MKHRLRISTCVLATLFGVVLPAPGGFAGQAPKATPAPKAVPATSTARIWKAPRTAWGDPDLQGIYTVNDIHGVPLERPTNAANRDSLTDDEAAARRERATLASIWGYDREWRDTSLGYVKTKPSGQVAMVVDPPDGRIPAMTPDGKRRAAEIARRGSGLVEDSEEELQPGIWADDLGTFVRCITRGLPAMWLPGVYNNGVQIVQGPGYVVITKEMIHEARVIPLDRRPALGAKLTQWIGDSRGHWEGDTLVVEVTNFNGKVDFRGSSKSLRLVERFRRIGPETIDYSVTIDDPATWTRPWTINFPIQKDDSQYDLVEYACHEGNYGLVNILSAARAMEKAAEKAVKEK